jgi:hypothetical protein
LKPGTVFRWDNFPYPRLGTQIKARWFVYLGDTGELSSPVIVHVCTTTTSEENFKPGGKREHHRFIRFDSSKSPFGENCILDFDEPPYHLEKQFLESQSEIEVKGALDQLTLKTIYQGILISKFYSRKILLDIHTSLNLIGITGLKKP